jgi:aminopeptidase N
VDWKEVLSTFSMQFVLSLAPVLASLLTAWVLAKVRAAYADLKAGENAKAGEMLYYLEYAARIAVRAAEQAGMAGLIADKRKYAFDVIEKALASRGFVVDIDIIYAAIEAAVMQEFNKDTGTITIEAGEPKG